MKKRIEDHIPKYLRESKLFNVNATDLEGNFIYVNDTFKNRFSFLFKDFIGVYSMETILPEDHNICIEAVEKLIQDPTGYQELELRKPSQGDVEYEWTSWQFSMLFNENNEPFGMLCIGYQITDLKELLTKLEIQNKELASIAQKQAHQIRGPISTLLMALELFKTQDSIDFDERINLLSEAVEQTDSSIKDIIRGYLEDIKSKSDKNDDNEQDYNVEYEIIEILGGMSKIGYWSYNVKKDELFWSHTTKRIHEVDLNYTPNINTGINFYKEGYYRNKITEAVNKAIETGEIYDEKLKLITQKGNEIWVRAIGRVEQKDGKITKMYGTFQDINDSELKNQRLENILNRLNIATEGARLGIWEWNLKTNDLYWNDIMYELYGIKPEDFSGHYEAWEKTLAQEDRDRSFSEIDLAIKEKKSLDFEFKILKPNGQMAKIRAQAKLVKDKNGEPLKLVGVNSDITTKSIIDDKLTSMYKTIEDQNKYLYNFSQTITHNIKSSANNLKMIINNLKSDISNKDSETEYFDMFNKTIQRLDATVDGLNETISIRFNESKFSKVHINTAIDKATDSISQIVKDSKVDIKNNIPDDLNILGIDIYFESIFQNLITNSIKYAKPNTIATISIDLAITEKNTIITFTDQGIGIDLKKYGSKIFGMNKTFHGNPDAKGLGLYLIKNQISVMGGEITVNSAPNQGAKFIITFKN